MNGPGAEPTIHDVLDETGLTTAAVRELHEQLAASMRSEVAVVAERGLGAIPTVTADDIVGGRVPASDVEAIRRRGCVVVRGTFDRSLAEGWDAEIGDYLRRNDFERRFAERYPDAEAASRIWAIYWSRPQVDARQHADMALTRHFLNSLWRHESDGVSWFEPDGDIGYPDRLRRRAPGVAARGLPPHSDSVASGGWRFPENRRVFGHVLAGHPDRYDPWDAAHRTGAHTGSAAPSSVFRSFQGWTALSEMRPSDGVLHVIPIPSAAAYMLMRGIAGELGLLEGGPEPAPRRARADDLLLRALVPIPDVQPGDTVWWHGDVIHAVAPAANEVRWGNVMYIGAAPPCARNDAYQRTMYERFVAGRSPVDFPDEDFEVDFVGRATVADLDARGRAQFGLEGARSR